MDILSHSILYRAGEDIGGATRREQTSIDFLINEASLLDELVRRSGGHSDFMGCLAKSLPEFKSEAVSKLTVDAPPDTESGRVVLYQCPECGDIGCGAYTVLIEFAEGVYTWRSFAYENGYEPAALVSDLGPFRFESQQYVTGIASAASAL